MIINVLAIFGASALVLIIILTSIAVFEEVKDRIAKKRWRYKVEHRFDKPPTAKCYCIDCARWEDGVCHKFKGWKTADNWFCWDAYPKAKEDEEDEG